MRLTKEQMEQYIQIGDHWKRVAFTLPEEGTAIANKRRETARRMARNSYAFALDQAWHNRAPIKGGLFRRVALCKAVWELSDRSVNPTTFEPVHEEPTWLAALSALARRNADDTIAAAPARKSRARRFVTEFVPYAVRTLLHM